MGLSNARINVRRVFLGPILSGVMAASAICFPDGEISAIHLDDRHLVSFSPGGREEGNKKGEITQILTRSVSGIHHPEIHNGGNMYTIVSCFCHSTRDTITNSTIGRN